MTSLNEALTSWASRELAENPITAATEEHLYALNEVQADWLLPQYRQSRFERATTDPSEARVLYRPLITNEIFDFVQNCPPYHGVMVRGPQGIGKSFTLLNLYRRLVSEGHFVVFLPRTSIASNYFFYAKAIKDSLGVSNLDIAPLDEVTIHQFIESIVRGLPEGKKFYFIFDQINEVFSDKSHPGRKISQLGPPHELIDNLRSLGVVPIISTSANNSTAYKDNHEGFKPWSHPVSMKNEELESLFPDFSCNDDTFYLTANIPLYVSEYLKSETPETYEKEARNDVKSSLVKLLNESYEENKIDIRNACAHAVLDLPLQRPRVYDRKSSTLVGVDRICKAVFPLVKEVYREFCISEVMELTRQNESALGEACNDPLTPKRAKASMFEVMVIRRLFSAQLSHSELPPRSEFASYFAGDYIPNMDKDGLWVPKMDKFPAVDFLWKYGNEIWGVQVHSGTNHVDVLHQFKLMCRKAGLTGKKIRLIWLSQDPSVSSWAKRCRIPATPANKKRKSARVRKPQPHQLLVSVHALHIGELGPCMDGFPWTRNE